MTGSGSQLGRARIVCHVLALELPGGLALVDTGFGTDDVRDPRRLGQPFRALIQPRPVLAETAVHQLRELNLDPGEVRDLIATHLDIDHVGGLPDFPDARVHVFEREYAAAMAPSLKEKVRYAGATAAHWAHNPDWVTHGSGGDRWMGFESVRVLPDSGVDVALIPLPGHTRGHCAVAVPRGDEGWLLHCGDGYFHHGEVATPPYVPPGLSLFQSLTAFDNRQRRQNQERLRELAREHSDEVTLICSHDPTELGRERSSAGGLR